MNAKDLLEAVLGGDDPELSKLARPLRRVSDSTSIDELLTELRRDRQHIVLVADEHGTTVGLDTLEDILEEIVGEIEDEFDPTGAGHLITRHDGLATVKGAAPIHLVAEELGIEISNPHEATIGGHVLELLGRLPEVGELIDVDGHRAEVTGVGDARILELRFALAAGPREPGTE